MWKKSVWPVLSFMFGQSVLYPLLSCIISVCLNNSGFLGDVEGSGVGCRSRVYSLKCAVQLRVVSTLHFTSQFIVHAQIYMIRTNMFNLRTISISQLTKLKAYYKRMKLNFDAKVVIILSCFNLAKHSLNVGQYGKLMLQEP